MELTLAFGRVIRRLRIAKNLTQENLGFEADLRRTYISSLELGQKEPSLSTILKIAKALDMGLSELFLQVEKELGIYR
ncbi:helix-turn-helix transcriptional regulator [Polynucleobacter paneuropaeus]|nr:helix-turn-helix transcriptional regulator [Polynucleobacter paneuropaeus]MBT8521249.1 helix-turn-helix transcriptional regulator [Polynucleobacter paneuropaeus]MBT8538703.1 helix-turn-helix transcriptional regulator [Polynucleobacter paneuropaeus]RAZ47605.1 XRE family transcriptional regulator [Polynucleobacter paneuropaeus]